MYNFSIGSLPLITNGEANTGFILQTPITGFDSPDHRTNTFSRPGRHGATISTQFYDHRLVSITGKVWGSDPTTYHANRRQFINALAIQKDDNGYPVPIQCPFTTLDGESYFVNVYFDKPLFNHELPTSAVFMVNGVVGDPFIYGAAQTISPSIMQASGGGYIVPMIVPYISAPAAGGSIDVFNDGSEDAYPIITLPGTMTNPILQNQTTGKTLSLAYSIASGDTVVIDMDNQTITLNNSSSLIATKTEASDWWTLAPGSNTIRLETSTTSDTGAAVVSFYPPYVGV